MKKLVLGAAIMALISSCSIKESDFAGKYSFNNVNKVHLKNSAGDQMLAAMFNTDNVSKEKKYFTLNPIKIDLFVDESDKINGEIEVVMIRDNGKSGEKEVSINLDMEKFRMSSDTLWFSMSNAILKSKGKSYKGFLCNDKDNRHIGLTNEMVGKSKYMINNPSWIGSTKDSLMTIFSTAHSSKKEAAFYTSQISDYQKELIENLQLRGYEKQRIKNSIEHLQSNYLPSDEGSK